MNKITIFCDGGCRGNQSDENTGGWGVVLRQGTHEKLLKGHEFNTTNNQMELKAAIEALKALKTTTTPVEIFIDSAYVINGITKWVDGWIAKGWRTADKKPVKNKEIWQELIALKNQFVLISFIKVKGHSTSEGNNLADKLANIAMDEAVKK